MSSPNFFAGFLALGSGSTSFVELAGSGYARIAITFGPAVSEITSSATGLNFPGAGTWPTATQMALYDASGKLILWWNCVSVSPSGVIVVSITSVVLSFPASLNLSLASSTIFAPGSSPAMASIVPGALSSSPGTIVTAPAIAGVPLQFAAGQVGAF